MATFSDLLEILLGQWQESPKMRAIVADVTEALRADVLEGLRLLATMLDIDQSVGVWLDARGEQLGLSRPSTTAPAMDPRWGFDLAGTGFDQVPFQGEPQNDSVFPLPDSVYRQFVKARALTVRSDGTHATFVRAVRMIDPSADVQDHRDRTIRIVTDRQQLLELADRVEALPRNAGVSITYADRGRFGFDEAGVPFDSGPFEPG